VTTTNTANSSAGGGAGDECTPEVDGKVEIDSEFAINRKDFGIVCRGVPDDLIKDDVLIKLKFETKQA
jgi:hypothetical protein